MGALRIAAHISASEWGGAERRSLALLQGLAARGHRVLVYTNTEFIAERAREHHLPATVRPLGGDIMVRQAFHLARELKRYPPDVLLLITFRRLWLGALAGRIAGVPRIIARVGMNTDVARNIKYRFVLQRWIDDVVVNAQSMLETFRASLAGGSRLRVHVIPNGVAVRPADMSPADARAALGIPAGAFVVGTVARLVSQKRLDRLLRAAALLDDAWIVIAGDGAERAALERLARELHIGERVRMTGPREDVGNVLAALDAYVVASDKEGMSSGMLEALAAGVPVVSTRVSGAEEALLAPPCGIVVDADEKELAGALRRLQEDVAFRRVLAETARSVAADRYSLERMITRWDELLTSGGAP